jgi:predicted nucleotidyltransferase
MIGQKSKKVGQNTRLLEFIYENPQKELTVRQLALRTKISRSTVQYQLKMLRSQGIISPNNQWMDTWQNRLKKIHYYIDKIAASGVIDYLEKELVASTIILFGSFRKGESIKESDIDLFVECAREKEVDLRRYEKKLGHTIQLFTRAKIKLLPKRLLNNVVNGIKLKGYFTI